MPATGGPPASELTVTQPPVTTPEPDATPEPAASLTPGTIQFRVVNLREEGTPVDVYVRTMGLVQAAPVQMGLGYAEVTDYFAPPDPGTVVITTAGAGDPTCVAECPHIISSSSTNFG
ncbi:MAG TPA: hypothetical protein VMO81_04350, partial [Aestuariivirgaceae bacterium]|nr:hypothetical protein [Aestuariivirgaceae bacterium]